MKLFLTGGTGFIGARFCQLALERGHQVKALVRPASASRIPAGVHRVLGSLPYDVPLTSIEESDAIVHLAAVTTSQKTAESQPVNEFGTEFLLALASKAKCPFLFTSTQSVHSENQSAYAVTKRRCEELIRESGVEFAILRPGLVYGPGENGLYARMKQTVKRMPVLPMLGGGKALVQHIHVDDLCEAMFRILDDFPKYGNSEFDLGDPDGITLKKFLGRVALSENRKSRQINIPLAPVKLVLGTGEKLGLPLPISMDNLRGLETVTSMDTRPSLEKLGITLRGLDEGLSQSSATNKSTDDDRMPMVLIGAGKIGIVHGLQLMHNHNARLVGIVEPNRKAAALYRSMGFQAPFFSSLADALKASPNIRAAIIATPADTHLSIARLCLDSGLHILVEKPLSVDADVADKWRDLKSKYPDRVVHSGYMAAQFPHLFTAYRLARMNKLGHIYTARLVALQTHIMASKPVRWEMLKERAGGGVMINFGCHTASMLFRLIGWPDTAARGRQWSIHSSEVEDAIIAKFSIKSTQCSLVASWSIPGFARPFNLVELECEHGTIRVENSCIKVTRDNSIALMETQIDYDLPFNMAPDYTGGGFALEHEAFTNAIRSFDAGKSQGYYKSEFMPPVEMAEALRLETWIRDLYSNLQREKPGVGELREFGIPLELCELLIAQGNKSS